MRCPACGFTGFPNLTVCKKCGKPLPASVVGSRPAALAGPPALKPSSRPPDPSVSRLKLPLSPIPVTPETPPDPFFTGGTAGSVAGTPMLGGRHPAPPPPAQKDSYFLPADSVDVRSRGLHHPTIALVSQEDLVPAGFWIRFVAWAVDLIILVVLGWMAAKVLGVSETDVRLESLDALWGTLRGAVAETAVDVLISLIYSVVLVGWRGQTPGKMLLRLKIIRTDGGEVSYFQAFMRWIGEAISFFLLCIGYFIAANSGDEKALFLLLGTTFGSAAIFLIGYIMAAFTENKRALHDYIAGTRVVRL